MMDLNLFMRRGASLAMLAVGLLPAPAAGQAPESTSAPRPNVVLILADDLGWGETSYAGHPTLETPEIDRLAADGLTMMSFYATPNCSPSRASLLTGRSNDRTGVTDHGYRLRTSETTLAELLAAEGYATGHFGKWHLSGVAGPGLPVLIEDPHGPGAAGFETWISSTNYFEDRPVLSRNGWPVTLAGDSSEAVAAEAIDFMAAAAASGRPFLAIIQPAAPHLPWQSVHDGDSVAGRVDGDLQAHHGEIVGLDNSVGLVRAFLAEAGLTDTTLVWFQSDNGGLDVAGPEATGGLRGFKGSLHEGGVRVPSAVAWPGIIHPGGQTDIALSITDVMPTIAALVGVPREALLHPLDGEDLSPLLLGGAFERAAPVRIRHGGRLAVIDGHWKLLVDDLSNPSPALYDLAADPGETEDLAAARPDLAGSLLASAMNWSRSVDDSLAGADYDGTATDIAPSKTSIVDSPIYGRFAEVAGGPPPPLPSLTRQIMGQRDVMLVAVAAGCAILLSGTAAGFVLATGWGRDRTGGCRRGQG